MQLAPRSGGALGRPVLALGVVLLVVWVVSFVVLKITSLAIHLLLVGAVVFFVLQAIGRFRRGA